MELKLASLVVVGEVYFVVDHKLAVAVFGSLLEGAVAELVVAVLRAVVLQEQEFL